MQTIPEDASNILVERSSLAEGTAGNIADTLLRKLLLVDDKADGAEFAAALLRSHGMAVIVVHSAAEALQILQSERDIDAVLSDIMMPGMTGLQLADAVRVMYPAIKVILMSGYVSPERLRGREGAYLFVEKPYKMDTMLKVLRS
jgi:two-component system OmpR family response regulator